MVLLDIRMPGRNGYEVLKAVRSGYPNTYPDRTRKIGKVAHPADLFYYAYTTP